MIRYTTPTKTIRVHGLDLTGYDVTVSLRQTIGRSENSHTVDIPDPTVTLDGADTLVTVTLTQDQTGGFVPGQVNYQVNYGLGTARGATLVGTLHMAQNLMDDIVEFSSGTAEFDDEDEVASIEDVIAPGSIGSDELADGAVTTDKLANYAVTTPKLANTSVTTAKLATSAVTEGKIANSAVTARCIASGAVITTKLANGAVTPDKLSESYVETASVSVITASAIEAMFGGES